jgi:hypothetical protein
MTNGAGAGTTRFERALRRFRPAAGGDWTASPATYPNTLPSHMGLDGESYFLTGDDASTVCFLKLYRPGWLGFDIAGALQASRQAAGLKLAPMLLDADDDLMAAVFAAPGPDWRPAGALDFDRPQVVQTALAHLRAWHASAPLGRTAPSPLGYADAVEDRMGQRLGQITDDWSLMRDHAAGIAAALAATSPALAPLHRELYISNFLIGPDDALLMVDFDHAADGDPYADVGALALDVCEVEADYLRLVELYAGAAPPDLVARTQLHAILEDFRWGCLCLLFYSDPDRRSAADFLSYGRMRLSRCLDNIQAWRPDSLIGGLQ